MDELVIMHDKQVVTTSSKVAEIFEKEHKNVMQSIKNLTAENSAVKKMFVEDSYLNSRNQQQPMYYMNRDGFTLLAMGFTGSKAMEFKLKYIDAFNRMEERIKQTYVIQKQDSYMITDPVQRAKRWIEEQEENQVKLAMAKRETKDVQDNTPISSKDYQVLSRKIGQKLDRYLSQHQIYNKNQVALLRWDLNNAILKAAGVPARTLIKQKHFTAIAETLVNWEPSESTLEKMKAY
ncbi:phage regulatory protein [Lactobacillus salivarius]|jgi:Rha family phage regulatory protein|uniref:Tec protein n=2 Tax=Ligilactobacillus salivarius TaxID=1624 RepID=A0A0F7PUT4_9LACO|nr:Rha family transcriptional regulator [Ligilactobacillus salivarius]AKI03811.1 tec protein [Ligilactobacillus salivarius str. Ren]MYV07656.1 phage regulatory protein [Ligilactobacillus salivarius]MYY21413.1 phage regulatory protein [Ligilactobacillus salivarius]MYY73254.1 phage regulatory protein [Ligilactobacillus salivarius]